MQWVGMLRITLLVNSAPFINAPITKLNSSVLFVDDSHCIVTPTTINSDKVMIQIYLGTIWGPTTLVSMVGQEFAGEGQGQLEGEGLSLHHASMQFQFIEGQQEVRPCPFVVSPPTAVRTSIFIALFSIL